MILQLFLLSVVKTRAVAFFSDSLPSASFTEAKGLGGSMCG